MRDGSTTGNPDVGLDALAATTAQPTSARRIWVGQVRGLWRLSHPHLWLLSLGPAVVGIALLWVRGARLSLPLALAGIVAGVLAQVGATLLAEHARLLHSQTGASWEWGAGDAPATPTAARDALWCGVGALGLGALAGIPLALHGGASVWMLGLCGLAVALLYSLTPYALQQTPLGDLAVALALGPGILAVQVLGQRQPLHHHDLLIGIALGCLTLAVLQAAQLATRNRDNALGRRTLAVWLGARAAQSVLVLAVLLSFALVFLAAFPLGEMHGLLLAFLALPFGLLPLTGALRATHDDARALVVRQMRQVYALVAFWLLLGLVVNWLVIHYLPLITAS